MPRFPAEKQRIQADLAKHRKFPMELSEHTFDSHVLYSGRRSIVRRRTRRQNMPRKITLLAGACALTLALGANAAPMGGGGMGGNHVTPGPRPVSAMPRPVSPAPTPPRTVSQTPDPSSPVGVQPNATRPTPESPLMANPDIKAPGPTTGTRIRTPVPATPAEQR